jgi:hypothetical protein
LFQQTASLRGVDSDLAQPMVLCLKQAEKEKLPDHHESFIEQQLLAVG